MRPIGVSPGVNRKLEKPQSRRRGGFQIRFEEPVCILLVSIFSLPSLLSDIQIETYALSSIINMSRVRKFEPVLAKQEKN